MILLAIGLAHLPGDPATAAPAKATKTPTPTGSPTMVTTATGLLPPPDSPERRMYEAVNAERLRQGITPVAWSPELGTAAARHAADMARNGFLDHTGSDGLDQQQRAARAGYLVPAGSGWMVIEAVSGMPTLDGALGWLLGDWTHRRVLLRETWRETGMAFASAGGSYYWVLDFGCRPNVLPVFAAPAPDGKGLNLLFTQEDCSAYGGPQQMGRATELQVSKTLDFSEGNWEPYTGARRLADAPASLSVRLRDASGRQSAPAYLSLDALPASSSLAPVATPTPTITPTSKATSTPTPSPTSTPTSTLTATPTSSPTPTPEPTDEPEESS